MNEIQGSEPDDGYTGGYEITPTRRLATSLELYGDDIPGAGDSRPFASAVHQSWAPGPINAVRNALSGGDAIFGLAAYTLMPEQRRSLHVIKRMSDQLGGVPAVVFADQMHDGELEDFTPYGFESCEIQLSPEAYRRCGGGTSYRDLHNSLRSRGVHGIVPATHHLQRAAKADPEHRINASRLLAAAAAAGTLILRIHAEAGRVDTAHEADKRRTLQELEALLAGPEAIGRTAMGDIMAQSYEIWQRQRVTGGIPGARHSQSPAGRQFPLEQVYPDKSLHGHPLLPVTAEVPFGGLAAIRPKGKVPRADFVAIHRDITGNLRGFFDALTQRKAADR